MQLRTFASYALPCQTPFCQIDPLLSSVARQQNLTEFWREVSTSTAISPTPASDVVGQHNKIGGINFGATFVYCLCTSDFGNFKFTSESGKSSLQFSYNDCNFYEYLLNNTIVTFLLKSAVS
jgi:hypothetical protein